MDFEIRTSDSEIVWSGGFTSSPAEQRTLETKNTVRVTAAEAPGGSACSNYFGGTLMKRNLVVLTK